MGNWSLSSRERASPGALARMFWFAMGPKAMRPTDHGLQSPKQELKETLQGCRDGSAVEAVGALPEDAGSIPSTHTAAHYSL